MTSKSENDRCYYSQMKSSRLRMGHELRTVQIAYRLGCFAVQELEMCHQLLEDQI
jgi:hypothetical protein